MKTRAPIPLPLHRMAVFTPGRQSDDEIRASYIARQAVLDLILDDIRNTRSGAIPQHHIVIGLRGMGKTTLLKRLHVALREEPLASQFIPLGFPEEQYSVDRLSTVFLNCLDSLADTLEREEKSQDLIDRIDNEVERLRQDRSSDELVAQDAERTLMSFSAETGRRLVLLVDNLNLIFERLKKPEHHHFRAFLMKKGAPILIGAATHAPDDTQSYDAPFYDHFKPHYLSRLSLPEMREVLLKLAERAGNQEILARIDQEQGRLHALHALTGGNPRTTRILFEIFAHGFSQEAYEDLEALLDWMTPIYKARFEELSDQAQVVVSAIATIWEPAVLNRICEATRLQANQVSPQLDRLKKSGVIEEVTVDPPERTGPIPEHRTPKDRTGYQLAERFFNIWFLMRQATRRDKRNLIYLTRFIECLYTPEERVELAEDLLKRQALSKAEKAYGLALEQSLHQQQLRLRLHDHLIEEFIQAKNLRLEDIEDLIDPGEIPPQRWAIAELRTRLCKVVPTDSTISPEEFADTILSAPALVGRREEIAATPLAAAEVAELIAKAKENFADLKSLFGKSSAAWLASLFKAGIVTDFGKAEDLEAAVLRADSKQKIMCILTGETAQEAKKLSERAFGAIAAKLRPKDNSKQVEKWLIWAGICIVVLNRSTEGINALERVLTLNPTHAEAAKRLAFLFEDAQKPDNEILAAYQRAIRLDPNDVFTWRGLGDVLYGRFQHIQEAEKAYKEAIKIEPDHATWFKLSLLQRDYLGDDLSAEKSLRQAVKLEPGKSIYWHFLADVLAAKPANSTQAEAAYRKAVEYDPNKILHLIALGKFVGEKPGRLKEGAKILRAAVETDPESALARAALAQLLDQCEETKEQAVHEWLEVIKRDPQYTEGWLSVAMSFLQSGERDRCNEFINEAMKAAKRPTLLRMGRLVGIKSSRPDKGRAFIDILRKATPVEEQHELLFDEIMLDAAESNWGNICNALVQLLDRLGERMTFRREDRDSWIDMSAALLHFGHGEKVIQLLAQIGADQRLRPWAEALRAHVRGDRKYLRNTPVEVRESAGQMYDEIASALKQFSGNAGSDAAAPKNPRRKAPRQTKRNPKL